MAGAALPTFEGLKDHLDTNSKAYTFAGGILADTGTVTKNDDGTYDTSLISPHIHFQTKQSLPSQTMEMM